LIARQSLPSQDVRVSPLASIPAITEAIRPEEAGCSRGPADRISGASAGRSGEAIQRWHAFRDDPSVSHLAPIPASRQLCHCWHCHAENSCRAVPSASNPIPASLRTRRPVEPGADAAGKAACDGRHRRHRRSGWKGWRYRERPGIMTPRASFHNRYMPEFILYVNIFVLIMFARPEGVLSPVEEDATQRVVD
jgi:hypothetical protein